MTVLARKTSLMRSVTNGCIAEKHIRSATASTNHRGLTRNAKRRGAINSPAVSGIRSPDRDVFLTGKIAPPSGQCKVGRTAVIIAAQIGRESCAARRTAPSESGCPGRGKAH
jgi:hypothetical protein